MARSPAFLPHPHPHPTRLGARQPARPLAAAALASALALALALHAWGGLHVAWPRAVGSLRLVDREALLDGFEVDPWPDPALWIAGEGGGWRPSRCRARSGARSLRAFAGPAGAPEPDCQAPVAPGATSTAVLVLDLRAATDANRLDLIWELWPRLNAAPDAGLALFLRVPRADGGVERVPIFGATALADGWIYPVRQLDLRNLVDIRDPRRVYDLRGGRWAIEWVASAPAGAPPGGGVAIDDVRLAWEPDLVFPTPTPRTVVPPTASSTPVLPTPTDPPTLEPTPTPVPATATASASATRAPDETPRPHRLYLPVARRDPPPTPTPTPDWTATAPSTPATPGTPEPATATPGAGPLRPQGYLPAVDASAPRDDAYPAPGP